MPELPRDRPHIHIAGGAQTENYTSPRRPNAGLPPRRVRAAHARALERALGQAIAAGRAQIAQRDPEIAGGAPGFYLEFDLPVGERAAAESLENRTKKIELVAVSPPTDEAPTVSATVFVPEAAADFFVRKVEQYRDEDTPTGKPKNEALIARIETARKSPRSRHCLRTILRSCRQRSTSQSGGKCGYGMAEGKSSRGSLSTSKFRCGHISSNFPNVKSYWRSRSRALMERLIRNSDAVAELRIAKDTPTLFLEMRTVEQAAWARDLAGRVRGPDELAPAICILDSGVNRGHLLIAPALDAVDQHSYDPAWGGADSAQWNGHGTAMAGIALYADLVGTLGGGGRVDLPVRLESVKILPPVGQNDPDLYGAITGAAIDRVEAQAPRRDRVYCMAVTSDVCLGRGRPSSWSAAIDKLCYGGGDRRRLVVLTMGNVRGDIGADAYPDRNDLSEAENPAQAWNPLVVGAYTEKINIIDDDYFGWRPVAPAGELAPTSRTSGIWDRQWPIRPDVVLEGGNFAHDGGANPAIPIDDLRLLTTHYRPDRSLFEDFGDTSAATALCANIAARMMSSRRTLWPETIKGLVVHSAEWTPPMRQNLDAAPTQAQKAAMLRRYGYGVPDLTRGLLSAANDATLMVEDSLIPFRKDGSTVKTRDMNLHRLPWPRVQLEALGEQDVELRVTLSYFIEPNPGERGWMRRHRYASHGLRFVVKRSLENIEAFRQRINAAAELEEDGEAPRAGGADDWILGPQLRDRGTIHSDIWRGSAAELAERDAIGVFPVSGWWKEKPALNRWDRSTRYALIVSVRAPEAEIDIYTAIANQIAVPVEV